MYVYIYIYIYTFEHATFIWHTHSNLSKTHQRWEGHLNGITFQNTVSESSIKLFYFSKHWFWK